MKKYLAVLTLIMISMALLVGCGGSGGSSESKKQDTEKWNSYIAVGNSLRYLYDGSENYFKIFGDQDEYVKPQKAVSYNNPLSSGVNRTSFANDLKKALDFANQGKSELDQTAAKTFGAISELSTALDETYSYYRNKDYVDDNYAKAPKLHERIVKAYPAFRESMPEFDRLMDIEAKKRRQEEIKQLTAEGNKIRATMLIAIDAAKAMQDVLINQDITSENLQELNMDEFRPRYDEFLKALAEYEKVKDDAAQRKKEGIQDYSVSSVANCLKDVKASAAGLIERYQTKAKATSLLPGSVTGTPENFDQKMDMLITRYNQSLGN